jgi:hypothetical protein
MQSLIPTCGTCGSRPAVAAVLVVAFLTGRHVDAGVSQEGTTLIVDGTRGHDDVIIIGVDGHPGIVTVRFNDQPLVAHYGLTEIEVDLKGGNNKLAMVQVHMAGDVTVAADNGENLIILGLWKYMPNLIWGNLSVTAGNGFNEIHLNESWIIGNATIECGDGGNDVILGHPDSPSDLAAVIFGDLTVATGTSGDLVEVDKSWISGQTLIDTWDGADTVILGTHYEIGSDIAGNVFNDLVVATGDGGDEVGLTDNIVNGQTTIQTEDDNDVLLLGAGAAFPPNDFYGNFTAHGGGGLDTLDNDPGNFYAYPPQFHSFEL